MRALHRSLYLSLAVVGFAAPAAFAQASNTMSLIELATRKVTPFAVCASPSAVAWVPAQGSSTTCTCDGDDDDDDDRDGDHHDGAHGGKCECGQQGQEGRHHDRDGKHRDHDGDEDDDDCDADGGGGGGGGTAVSNVAYMVCETGRQMMKIDLTKSPPLATVAANLIEVEPSAISIDPTGTHALVSGGLPSGTFSYFDLTPNAAGLATDKGAYVIPSPTGFNLEIADLGFWGSTKAVVVIEDHLYVVDLTQPPPGDPTRIVSIALASPGQAIAVDSVRNRAVVSLDLGGAQVIDLATGTRVGGELGESGDTLGVGISPDGATAIALYESSSASRAFPFGMVVAVGATPSVTNHVDLSSLADPGIGAFKAEASAVAFNPVTSDALVVGDFGVAILKPPYAAVDSIIRYPAGYSGTDKRGIAADGTRALVLNEDFPVAPVPPRAPAASAILAQPRSRSGGGGLGHDQCHQHDDGEHRDREHRAGGPRHRGERSDRD